MLVTVTEADIALVSNFNIILRLAVVLSHLQRQINKSIPPQMRNETPALYVLYMYLTSYQNGGLFQADVAQTTRTSGPLV